MNEISQTITENGNTFQYGLDSNRGLHTVSFDTTVLDFATPKFEDGDGDGYLDLVVETGNPSHMT
ncbi:MAG TPA: hypothetical protein VLB84_20550, partial [Bacteroidia bacterium]|nr:hypothetical protein [Bacteroidia bacterium]